MALDKNIRNIKINIEDKDLSFNEAIKIANQKRKEENITNGFIYIVCPNISDLFIIKFDLFRRCNNKEWNAYFNTYIYPRE